MVTSLAPAKPKVSPEGQTPKKSRGFWRAAGEFVLITGLMIGGLETAFAFAGIGEGEYLRPDPIVGTQGIPNKAVTQRKEGFGRFRYNRFGWQDVERSLLKPQGTKRIAIVGDSLIEALQVDRSRNFCSLLQGSLNNAGNSQHFEVLNCGVSMTNLSQMYLRIKHRVLQFQPDIVIVPVRVDAALQLSPNADGGFFFARPNFFADGNGNLIQDDSVQKLWLRSPEGKRMRATEWLREHSRIWGVVCVGIEQFAGWVQKAKEGQVRWGAEVTDKQTAFAPGANSAVASIPSVTLSQSVTSSTPVLVTKSAAPAASLTAAPTLIQTPAQTAANLSAAKAVADMTYRTRYFGQATKFEWHVADALIHRIKEECDQHQCKLVLLRLPGGNNWRNELETTLLKQTAERYQIPLLDTTEPFHQAWTQNKQLFFETHFTPLSHQIMAAELYRFMHQEGLDK